MKYSEPSLELAIDTILPHIKEAKDAGAYNETWHPEMLKNIAVEYFLKKTPLTQEEMLCFSVARQAISDLTQYGAMKFGDKELSAELDTMYQMTPSMQSPCCLN